MKLRQVVPPDAEELQAYCLGKGNPQRAQEIEAYLAAGKDTTAFLEARPQDALLEHLWGAKELAELRTILPCVPGYEILAELGRGGMGVVYKARHLALNRFVAIKMILAGGHAAAADLSRFRREAETGASLQHPNIVQVYEIGNHNEFPYLALEYVEGGTLAQKTGGVPLPAETATDLVELLARAVDHAHHHGVIHRDLKPANVLLTAAGVPKLSDFGLARRTGNQGMTMSGAILGTPGYLAPEQAGAQAAAIGPRTDVYGLGAILYYLLTGRAPVEAATPAELIRRTLECDPVRPAFLRPGVPRDLETICLKCLHKDPAGRYPTALALAEDLQRFRLGEPIVARPVGRVERGWRWCRRNPAVALSSAAAVLLLVTVTVVSVLFAFEQRSAANNLQLEKESTERTANQLRIEKDRVQAALKQSRSHEALLLGDRAIRICEEGADGQAPDPYLGLLWLARAVALAPEEDSLQHLLRTNWSAWQARVCPTQGILTVPQSSGNRFAVWSPDGKQVLVGSDQGLEVWDVRGWRKGPTLPFAGKIRAVAWSPDSYRVACGCPAGEPIRIWNLKDHSVRTIQPPDAVNDLNFSGDAKQLAAACVNGEVPFWDAASGESLGKPLSLKGQATSVAFHPRDGRFLTTTPSVLQQWALATRTPIGPSLSPNKNLRYASYSGDGKHFIVTGYRPVLGEHHITVYATATGQLLGPQASAMAASIHLSPDGKRTVAGLNACRAEVWETANSSVLFTISGHQHEVVTAAFRPDGRAILTASKDGRVRLSALPNDSLSPTFAVPVQGPPHLLKNEPGFKGADGLRCLAVSPNGQWLFVGGWDQTGWVLDARDGSVRGKITGHEKVITAAAFTPDGLQLLTASADQTVSLWEVGSWRRLHEPWPIPALARNMCISPDGSLAIVGNNRAAQLLRLRGSVGVQDHELWGGSRSASVFMRDGNAVLFGKGFGVHRWDLATQTLTDLQLQHTSSVSAVGLDPEGRRVATGAYGVGQIWDLQTGNPIGPPLQEKKDRFTEMVFSPNGRLVASLTLRGSVRFWDATTGRPVGPVLKHPGVGNALVFHPDGSTILTGSSDALVRRWQVPRPVIEEASLLKLRTEVLTGMELDAEGVVRILSTEVWRQRRQQLQQLAPSTVSYLETE